VANAEIVTIGSEILLGQIVDTNSAWMAQRLSTVGINLFYKTVVGDNPGRMREILAQALDRSDLVITSGGLGPTQDDLTREIVAEATGRKLVLHQDLLEQIERRFRRRGLIMTPNNERQAYVPEGAIPVENPNGTAPSFIVEDPRGVIFALPGVPFEMKWLFDNQVMPYVKEKFKLSEIITYRVLKVTNLGESSVDDRIGSLIANSSNPTVGVLAHPGQVDVRITAKAANIDEAMKLIEPLETEVRRLLGHHVFATDDETMEDTVGKLLREKGVTIAVYEDLTGGLVAERLQLASSEWFVEGLISAAPPSLRRILAFSRRPDQLDDLSKEPVTLTDELAWAVRAQAKSNLGLAVHGIPDLEDRAVNLATGQTFISVTDGKSFKRRTYNMAGRGRPDRTRMSLNAIGLVRTVLMEGLSE